MTPSYLETAPAFPRRSPISTLVFMGLAVAASPLLAQGGPPLISDDPDTPGPGHWEINVSIRQERTAVTRHSEAPLLDINYGVGQRIQLKLEVPWALAREGDSASVQGLGDAVAGIKWRFVGEEGERIAWAVYPQYEFELSASSARKGLVPEGHQLLLPTELTLQIHHVELNFEAGRTFPSAVAGSWIYGLASEVSFPWHWELVGEIHGEKQDHASTVVLLNGGARWKLSRQMTLMGAIGRAVAGDANQRPRLLLYGGFQLNLPHTYHFPARSH